MDRINVFQDESDLYEEFWYQQRKRASVAPNILAGYFTIWVYHTGDVCAKKVRKYLKRLSKIYKLKQEG